MAPKKVKEETADRIVLVDSVRRNILHGLFEIILGSFSLLFGMILFISDGGLFDRFFGSLWLILGGVIILMGLYHVTIKKSVIIDRRRQNIIIKKYLSGKYIVSTKTIPFPDIKRIEITYYTHSGRHDYDSPADHIYHSYDDLWVLFLITVHEDSIQIYDGSRKSKSKVEKIAKKICEITGKKATHKTSYYFPDIGG
jgi:hypothetical protein